jgi:hypothetical protein
MRIGATFCYEGDLWGHDNTNPVLGARIARLKQTLATATANMKSTRIAIASCFAMRARQKTTVSAGYAYGVAVSACSHDPLSAASATGLFQPRAKPRPGHRAKWALGMSPLRFGRKLMIEGGRFAVPRSGVAKKLPLVVVHWTSRSTVCQ